MSGIGRSLTWAATGRGPLAPADPLAQCVRLPKCPLAIQMPAPTVVAPKATATGRDAILRRNECRLPHDPLIMSERRTFGKRVGDLGMSENNLPRERRVGADRLAMHVT